MIDVRCSRRMFMLLYVVGNPPQDEIGTAAPICFAHVGDDMPAHKPPPMALSEYISTGFAFAVSSGTYLLPRSTGPLSCEGRERIEKTILL